MPNCYETDFRVFHYECDPWDRMAAGAVLRRVQEVGTRHCEALGIDEALYRRTHTAFLLSKVSLLVCGRMPAIEEEVHMQTRAYGMRRAVYHRATTLYAAGGAPLCEVDARWVLVDTENRRILRKPLDAFLPHFSEEPVYAEHDLAMPAPPEKLCGLGTLRAVYSLCDRNGHVNNTRYADLVCDCLPEEKLQTAPPKRLLFFYRSEIPMGSTFALSGGQTPAGGHYFAAHQGAVKSFEALAEF